MGRLRRWYLFGALFTPFAGANAQMVPPAPPSTVEFLPPMRLEHCPPGTIPPSTRPGTTSPMPKSKDASSDPTQPPAPANPDTLARAPEAGAQPAATLNPNMFGDQFGSTKYGISTIQSRTFLYRYTSLDEGGLFDTRYQAGQGTGNLLTPSGVTLLLVTDNGRTIQVDAPSLFSQAPLANAAVGTTSPVSEGAPVSAAVQQLNPGKLVVFIPSSSFATVINSLSGTSFSTIDHGYQISSVTNLAVALPSPAGGGVVGRTKLSDDNSPMPRDRVIFGADLFSNTILAANGFDVTRLSPGVELTFFDRWTSIELRAPFASTVDSTSSANGITARSTVFGNGNVTFKGLLVRGNEINVAAGLGLSVPTGPDTRVLDSQGNDFVRITNDSWIATPYLAALWTPGNRFFSQVWGQVGIDPTGSRVFIGGQQVGRVYDQTVLALDAQVGYWVLRGNGLLRGFAPFAELHYNTSISDATQAFGSNAAVRSQTNRFDELNVTVGASAQFGTNLLVSAGVVMPLRGGDNRFFDSQIGLRANWFFGPTADARALADATDGRIEPIDPATGLPSPAPEGANGDGAGAMADVLARAPETGAQPAATLNPGFFGDFIGVTTRTRAGVVTPVVPRYAGLKISDGDSPRPADRAYFIYQSYDAANPGVNPVGTPETNITRQILGLETTLGPRASVGLRIPFIRSTGTIDAREVGDMTVTGKYALYLDDQSGDVFSVGTNVSLPTGGRGAGLADGRAMPRAIFVQPWLGGRGSSGNYFYQGIAAIALPADPIYPTAMFASAGAGYWLYRNERDSLIRGFAPVVELHANVPVTNRRGDAPVTFVDQMNVTAGAFLSFPKLTVGGAVCVPFASPKPFDLEAMLSVSYNF